MSKKQTHLAIVTQAYDKCDIGYVLRKSKGGYTYLFLVGRDDHAGIADLVNANLDNLTRQQKFMEFDTDGSWASY